MKRLLVTVLVATLVLTLAIPGAAAVKERQAEGVTSFMLNPTCDPTFSGDPGTWCPIVDGEVLLGLANPGSKTGTIKGSQLFEGVLAIASDGSLTMTGSVVFTGRVKACGYGTVEFDVAGSGFLTPGQGSGAFFETNEQTIVGGSLPIEGVVRELGNGTGNEDGTAGTLEYEGEYTCDQRGRGHS